MGALVQLPALSVVDAGDQEDYHVAVDEVIAFADGELAPYAVLVYVVVEFRRRLLDSGRADTYDQDRRDYAEAMHRLGVWAALSSPAASAFAMAGEVSWPGR